MISVFVARSRHRRASSLRRFVCLAGLAACGLGASGAAAGLAGSLIGSALMGSAFGAAGAGACAATAPAADSSAKNTMRFMDLPLVPEGMRKHILYSGRGQAGAFPFQGGEIEVRADDIRLAVDLARERQRE